MLNFFLRMMRNRKGFTLVELLVVVVIIGVLATIGIQTYSNATDRGNLATAKANLRTTMSALELYRIDNGRYPKDKTADSTEGLAKLVPNYLKKLPNGVTETGYDSDTGASYTLTVTIGNATVNQDDL